MCAAMLGPAVAALLYTALIGNPTVAGAIYYISKAAFAALPVVWLRGVAGLPIGLAGPQPAGLITGLAFAATACAAVIGAYQLPSVDRLDPEGLRRRVELFGVRGH